MMTMFVLVLGEGIVEKGSICSRANTWLNLGRWMIFLGSETTCLIKSGRVKFCIGEAYRD